jgi:hypothetical protein
VGPDGCRKSTHHLNTEKKFINQEASFGSAQCSPIMVMSEEKPQEFALNENHLPSSILLGSTFSNNTKMSHKSCMYCGHNWRKNPLFSPYIVSRPPCLTKHSNKTATVSETLKIFLANKMDIIYKYTEEEE